jgi:L-lactate dehydrogenase complex protein LldE
VRVALFATCLGDTMFPGVVRSTVRVLERLGQEVVFDAEQTCCGQLHLNSGYRPEALALARRFVRVFGGAEAVVAPSASCVGMVRESYAVLAREAGDEELGREVSSVASRVFELSEYLVGQLGVEDVGASFPHRVTYHPTCHSLRVTRVGDAPVRLLRRVEGLELVELAQASECCGFGGTFALKNADVSVAMGEDKCRAIVASGASVCSALDGSCLLHLGGLLSRRGEAVRTVHVAEILASGDSR